ncbi:MAG TPA: hypothetical protein PLB18_08485 [Acidobacteriota bacterium]|nr:hypothetical protein [Acidobacteriota bacterium]
MKGLELLLLSVLILLSGCGLTGAVLMARLYLRQSIEQLDKTAINRSGIYQFFVGLFNFILLMTVAIVLAQIPALRILALLILFAMTWLTFLGLTTRMRLIGLDVMLLHKTPRASEIIQVLVGGAIVTIVAATPLLGICFAGIILIQSFGTGLLWLVTRRKHQPGESDLTAPIRPPETKISG